MGRSFRAGGHHPHNACVRTTRSRPRRAGSPRRGIQRRLARGQRKDAQSGRCQRPCGEERGLGSDDGTQRTALVRIGVAALTTRHMVDTRRVHVEVVSLPRACHGGSERHDDAVYAATAGKQRHQRCCECIERRDRLQGERNAGECSRRCGRDAWVLTRASLRWALLSGPKSSRHNWRRSSPIRAENFATAVRQVTEVAAVVDGVG